MYDKRHDVIVKKCENTVHLGAVEGAMYHSFKVRKTNKNKKTIEK